MFKDSMAAPAAVLSVYTVTVEYHTEPTSWDTYSRFTVQAWTEDQALKLCRQMIGEFHAPLTLRVIDVEPADAAPRVIATEPLAV